MTEYVYRWNLRPEPTLAIELRVVAPSAAVARREMRRFLVDHDGSHWTIECVARETRTSPVAPLILPENRLLRPS